MSKRTFSETPARDAIVVLWSATWNKRYNEAGLEHVVVRTNSAQGGILGVNEQGRPFRIDYRIQWDDGWCTRTVDVGIHQGTLSNRIILSADGAGHWYDADGRELSQLADCLDVDVWPTPFTNTLPIRRLQLQSGQRAEIVVAHVDALEGSLRRARQAYTRTGERQYTFESIDSGFQAELEVDEFGLVVEYPDLFTRVRTPPGK